MAPSSGRSNAASVASHCDEGSDKETQSLCGKLQLDLDASRLSFRRFVMACFKKGSRSRAPSTPEDLLLQYHAYDEQHRQRCAVKFWESHGSTGLMRDRLHEANAMRRADWVFFRTRAAAGRFLTRLEKGHFKAANLMVDPGQVKDLQEVPELGPGPRSGVILGVVPSQAPHFLMQDDDCTLILEAVPPEVTAWDFCEALQNLQGFLDAHMEGPEPGSLLRTGYARFETEQDLTAAIKAASGMELAGFPLGALKVPLKDRCNVLLMPSYQLEGIAQDADLALKAIFALESALGLPKDETELAMGKLDSSGAAEGDEATRLVLDLRILYLRHVHNCCFYSGIWCEHSRELSRRCGSMCLRSTDSTVEVAETSEHRNRLLKLLAASKLRGLRPLAPDLVSLADEPLCSRWKERCSAAIKQEAESRFRCLECTKMFKGDEYIRKHLMKAHGNLIEPLLKAIHEERMRKAFFANNEALREAQAVLGRSAL